MKSLLQRPEQAREAARIPWWALTLSAAGHCLVLYALSPGRGEMPAGRAPHTPLQAELRAAAPPVAAPLAVPREPTFATAFPTVRQAQTGTAGIAVAQTVGVPMPDVPDDFSSAKAHPAAPGGIPQAEATAAPVTVAIADAAAPSGPDASGLRQFRLALASEARHFRNYPEAARRAGLSGTVEVRISVEAGGAVRRAELSRSSGHAALDAAALEMLGKAAPRAALPESLRDHSFAVRLPVVFEVED